MRLDTIVEGPRDDIQSLLYDRLVQRVQLPAGFKFIPMNHHSTYNAVAWFARVVPKGGNPIKWAGADLDIGVVNGKPGLRVQQTGHADSWSQVQQLIQQRIAKELRLASKAAARVDNAKGLDELLNGYWSRAADSGVSTSVNDHHYDNRSIRSYQFKLPMDAHANKDLDISRVSVSVEIHLPLQSVRATSTKIYVQIVVWPGSANSSITLQGNNIVKPASLEKLFRDAVSYERVSAGLAKLVNKLAIYGNFDYSSYSSALLVPEDELRDYAGKNLWRVLHMVATGRDVPVISIPDSITNVRYARDNNWAKPILATIKDYLPNVNSAHATYDKLTIEMNTDYGHVQVLIHEPDLYGMYTIQIIPKQADGIANDQHLTARITHEQALDIFNTVHTILEKSIVGENYQRKLDRILREDDVASGNDNDDIEQDLAAQVREVLKDVLRLHPELHVKHSNYVQKGKMHGLFTLSHPLAKKPLDILLSGDDVLLVGSYGGTKIQVMDDAQLESSISNWIAGKKPKVVRAPRDANAQRERRPARAAPVKPMTISTKEVPNSSFFPHDVHHLDRKIPGRQVSSGKSFTLAIGARDIDIPDEIFSSMDLHRIGSGSVLKPSYKHLGWIGGSVDGTSMYINEVQSDLLQRTIELTNQEQFNAKNAKTIQDTKSLIAHKRRELAMTKREYTHAPASIRLRLAQEINQATKDLATAVTNAQRRFKLTNFSQFKSKVENFYKDWIEAFYHACFNAARMQQIKDVYIISSTKIGKLWGKASGKEDEEGSVYYRAYDKVAQNLGAKRVDEDWWHIRLDQIPQREWMDVNVLSSLLTEHVLYESEGVDLRRILHWLEHSGFTVDEIHGKHQEADFNNLNLIVTKIVDGRPITTQEYLDINPEQLHRALSFVQYDASATPVEDNEYELQELKRDAALLITAYKMIEGIPCGISIYSIQDPDMETYVHQFNAGLGFGGLSLMNDPAPHDEQPLDDQVTDADLFGFSPEELDDIWGRYGGS